MPATTTTTEKFDKNTTSEDDMKGLVELRLKCGAIRSTYSTDDNTWVLTTEWNVYGEQ
ncbi:MAG: hypothetical protein WAN11_19050 [Syntrophobacteraceae bacterium]